MYVKTDGQGGVLEYPYTLQQLKADNPNVSFPFPWPVDFDASDWDVFPVEEVAAPAPVSADNLVVEDGPVFTGSVWQQAWVERAPLFEELSEVKQAKRAAIKQQMALQIKLSAISAGLSEEDYELINEQDAFTAAVMAYMVANAFTNFRTDLTSIRQHARSLLNAVNAATTLTGVAAIDEATGWTA